jgi:hypothetical protein
MKMKTPEDFIWGLAPRAGLEPATLRLTAECSTIELSRNVVQNEHKNNTTTKLCQVSLGSKIWFLQSFVNFYPDFNKLLLLLIFTN